MAERTLARVGRVGGGTTSGWRWIEWFDGSRLEGSRAGLEGNIVNRWAVVADGSSGELLEFEIGDIL